MRGTGARCRALSVGLALVVLGASRPARAAEFPRTGFEGVATADGALGTIFNPALVGLRHPGELLLDYTRDEFGNDVTCDALGAIHGFGLRYTRHVNVEQRFGFSLAGGSPLFRLGWSPEWAGPDLAAPEYADSRVGALSRPAPWLSLGATVDHLFQPHAGGVVLNREYTVGAAIRPLALEGAAAHTVGTRLTLFADRVIPEAAPKDDRQWRWGGDLELLSGVVITAGGVGSHRYEVGLTLRLPGASGAAAFSPGPSSSPPTIAGVAPRSERADWTTYSLSFHSGEEPTRLIPPTAKRVAHLTVTGSLGDEDLTEISLLGGLNGQTSIDPVRRQLDRALEDPLTRGVLLDLGGARNSAAIEELRPRLSRLRAAGKPVVAYLEEGGGRGDLLLASACDRVFASESALFWQLGLRIEERYYRGLLARWGVRVDRSSIGQYKSAYRNYSVDSMPAPDREAIEHLLDQVQESFVATVSDARHIDRARLEALLDGRQWSSAELQKAGVIDSVGYREQALAELQRLAKLGRAARAVALDQHPPARREWRVPRGIAIVYATGAIESGDSGNDLLEGGTLGSSTLARQLHTAFRAPDVGAVVLRIDSPGGEMLASNLIYHALQHLKRETRKPLVVSMGLLGASGGYYIALPADRIFADRATRTGSIGVVFTHPSLEGFYAKQGVRQQAIERGAFMRGGSFNQDWDAELQASADSSIRRSYDEFIDKVAAARKLPRERVLEVAQGRVWLGDDALERGLIDEIGGLDQAIAHARKLAGIPEGQKIEPLELRRPRPSLLQRALGTAAREAIGRGAQIHDPEGIRLEADDDLAF
ncbi:MAG TPA: signal peptide peptidase SppA [Candidatus Sulfotelmatobacter sp.]|nr:signal peptide peptidase SppA [Candidatus Sulfotelmatobacter sp.]